jgi:DNA-binding transcriptional LysR family regulator
MHVSRIDLNLFTVFDAIYREGGITAASKRLHLSQPAVSHALARLRELLGDALFERHGNAMLPTPRARALASTIGSSLENLEQLLAGALRFEPRSDARLFRIAMRETQELLLLPQLAQLQRELPGIDIAAVRSERRDLEEDLQSGELDLALDIALPLTAQVRRRRVAGSPLVVLAARTHPRIQDALTLAQYLAEEHVLVSSRRRGSGYEDAVLLERGERRRVRMRCQQHATANELVRRSELLLSMPERHAREINRHTHNQLLPFPVPSKGFESFLYWHANVERDPANQWLREQVLATLEG